MERVYTIGADTHCAFTELATISPGGRLVRRDRCPTTIQALVQALAEVRRPRVVVIEEGPLADWLNRGLGERGETVVVCDPRRKPIGKTYNGLIKALERQAGSVLPMLKADLRRQAQVRLSGLYDAGKWLLAAVDGSKEDLPRTKDHEKVFGIADNGLVPQALMTTIVEVHTGLPWDWRVDVAVDQRRITFLRWRLIFRRTHYCWAMGTSSASRSGRGWTATGRSS